MTPEPSNEYQKLVEAVARAVIGIENRTAEEAFDIMADRIRAALSALSALKLPHAGDGEGVKTVVRQQSPIVADYSEHFLIAHVSKDGATVGIDHPCDAEWSDVMIAHVALRDRINERIAAQDGCPFKPTPPAGVSAR